MVQMHMELIASEYAGARLGIYKVWAEPSILQAMPTLHAHETYEMHIVTEGAYTFTVEDEAVLLTKHRCLILKPGTKHYSYDKTGDCTLISLHISLEKTEEADGLYSYFRAALDGAAGTPFSVSRALVGCVRAFEEEPFLFAADVYCRLKVHLSEIVYHLFSDIDGFGGKDNPIKSKHRVNSTAYVIECMVNEPRCTLADISARTGYSMRHTTRLIQSMYGKTLHEIRVERSVAHAKSLLAGTDKTVEEISAETGFRGASAMRRAFLRTEGVSPNEYRKLHQKETEHGTDKV